MKACGAGDLAIIREGLRAGVDHNPSVYGGADHCDQHMQRAVFERTRPGIERIAVVEDVRSRTNLREALHVMTLESSRRAAATDDFASQTMRREQCDDCRGMLVYKAQLFLLLVRSGPDVAGIQIQSCEPCSRRAVDRLRQREDVCGISKSDAVHAN